MPSRYEDDLLADRPSAAPFPIPIAPRISPYDRPVPRMPDEADDIGRKAYVAYVYGGPVANKPDVQKAITDQYEYNKKRVLSGKAPLEIANVTWHPSGYDDDTNEWINQRYQETGKLPSAEEAWDYIGHAAIQKQKEINFIRFRAEAGLEDDDQPQSVAANGSPATGQPNASTAGIYDPRDIAFDKNINDNKGKYGATGNAQDTNAGPVPFWKNPSPGDSGPSESPVLYPNTTLNATPPDDGFNPLDWNDWKTLAGNAGNRIRAGIYGVGSGFVGNAVNNLMGADNHVNIVLDGDRISVMDTGNAGYDPSDGKVREKVFTDGGYTFVESSLTEEELAKKLGYGSVRELKLALVNQKDYNDFINRGNAYSDGVRSNIASQYQDTYDKAVQKGGLAGSMLPGYGDAIDAREAYTGQDIRTGETLPMWQRGLAGAAMFLPLVGGATVRTVVDGAEDFVKGAAKHADEAVDALKQVDELGDAAKNAGELPRYPGNDPYKPPTEGYEWRGHPEKGSWYNPETREVMRSDIEHADPIGAHWDYRAPDGSWYRLYPDGHLELK